MQRNDLVIRAKTSIAQKLPAALEQKMTAATADGQMLPLMMIFKGKRNLKNHCSQVSSANRFVL